MQRLPFTSRDLAALRVAEQRAHQARPALPSLHVPPLPVPPLRPAQRKASALARLLRGLWSWLEQPEREAPPSRPPATSFYTEL